MCVIQQSRDRAYTEVFFAIFTTYTLLITVERTISFIRLSIIAEFFSPTEFIPNTK